MKIWVLRSVDSENWYNLEGSVNAQIVRADSEIAARRLAASEGGSECDGAAGNVWMNKKLVNCTQLGTSGEAEVLVVGDFLGDD